VPRIPAPPRAGLGGAPPPKTDLHRFVKWPKYVRLQRQKRVLAMRLKVPPAINQFVTRSLDKNAAETLFKLMLKYRPEDKAQKKVGGRAHTHTPPVYHAHAFNPS
jgi:large subunit ribosomal protein L7Ae